MQCLKRNLFLSGRLDSENVSELLDIWFGISCRVSGRQIVLRKIVEVSKCRNAHCLKEREKREKICLNCLYPVFFKREKICLNCL